MRPEIELKAVINAMRYSLQYLSAHRPVKIAAAMIGVLVILFAVPPLISYATIKLFSGRDQQLVDSLEISGMNEKLRIDITRLDKKLAAKIPASYYLVINTSANEFSLYRKNQLIRKDKCSTGSYVLLKNGDQQEWMFKTPKGEFRIQGKTTAPVWKKPDWAFVEEGLPIPASNHHSRFEYGVLGDYALSLGQGYLIHGTLYQRFIGLPVTHGCVRLNDENLELVYRSLNLGSKVYIY